MLIAELSASGLLQQVASASIFAFLGVTLLIGAFAIVDKITPYSLWREILEQKNTALAILLGCACIAMGIIIAAAIH